MDRGQDRPRIYLALLFNPLGLFSAEDRIWYFTREHCATRSRGWP
jgi:hypothetical protein